MKRENKMTVFKLGNLWGKLVQAIESFYPKPNTHIDHYIGYFLVLSRGWIQTLDRGISSLVLYHCANAAG
jgi:hypothetical protein